jgi:FSR family fosmidomycin resistance protein-like MFS transporter
MKAAAMTDKIKANLKVLFALTLVHFTGDFYSSFTTPLFPLFVDKFGLSLTQVGLIAGINRLLAFIVQPSVGYLADRSPTRRFILTGLLLTVVFIPLSGMAAGFWSLLIPVAIGSFGSSMFHPSVTGMVPLYAGQKVGFAMSVFNTGGTMAFAAGPLFITWYADRYGLDAVPLTMVYGLGVVVYIYFTLPVPQSEGLGHLGFFGSLKASLGNAWKTVALIWLVMFLRALVGQSFLTFLPVLYVQKGFTVVSAGMIFSLFTVSGTFSGLLAGFVSDRVGYKPVFLVTHALMAPVLWLFLQMEGGWVYAGAVLAGAFVLATMPLGVVAAQAIAPRGRSMVASLMMGFAYGLGGAITPAVGRMADLYSIDTVLAAMAGLAVATVPIILFFPESATGRVVSR